MYMVLFLLSMVTMLVAGFFHKDSGNQLAAVAVWLLVMGIYINVVLT